jgi:hypothetical protein
MKKHIWSDPEKEWDGFRFAAYWLDWKKVAALPITRLDSADGKRKETSLTVGDVFQELQKQGDQKWDFESGLGLTIKVGDGELTFPKPSFSTRVLEQYLEFAKERISPYDCLWFWYDSDWCRDDPHQIYFFFVVHKDRIVRERVSFSDYHGSGFNPDIFQSNEHSNAIWHSDSAWDEANTRYWYRKFYTETRTGQLMLLREDDPGIFDYQSRPGPDTTAILQNILSLLTKIRTLLLILIGLAVLIAFLVWK